MEIPYVEMVEAGVKKSLHELLLGRWTYPARRSLKKFPISPFVFHFHVQSDGQVRWKEKIAA